MSQSAVQEALDQLFSHKDLSTPQADAAMSEIMQGESTPVLIGAFLSALRMKGESISEITGCAQAMQRSAVQVRPLLDEVSLVDVVGTGGDGTYKFNISTIATFVVAGAGKKIAKHGNRSNKRAGSADVLEALGVELVLTAEQAAECINDVGLAFLFAPAYHPAMKHAIGARREIGSRTIFNFLGPATNPAYPNHALVGVYSADLTEGMAQVLGNMGMESAFVVHGLYETGAGLDEITTTGVNRISHLKAGSVNTFEFDASSLGMERATLKDLQGGNAAENAAIARGILGNKLQGPKREIVLLNAAAALSTESGDIASGFEAATQSLESGAALAKLDDYVAKTQSFG